MSVYKPPSEHCLHLDQGPYRHGLRAGPRLAGTGSARPSSEPPSLTDRANAKPPTQAMGRRYSAQHAGHRPDRRPSYGARVRPLAERPPALGRLLALPRVQAWSISMGSREANGKGFTLTELPCAVV